MNDGNNQFKRLPTEEEKKILIRCAELVKANIPKGYGFCLLLTPVGIDIENGAQFISDLERKNTPNLMRDTADRIERNNIRLQ